MPRTAGNYLPEGFIAAHQELNILGNSPDEIVVSSGSPPVADSSVKDYYQKTAHLSLSSLKSAATGREESSHEVVKT
jgi:hypothetical protein